MQKQKIAKGDEILDLSGVDLGASIGKQRAAKRSLDRSVARGKQNLIWVLPQSAIWMKIAFLPPFECLNKAIVYTRGTLEAMLPKDVHAWTALAKPAGKKPMQLFYEIEVAYPFGTLKIDPMVEILP